MYNLTGAVADVLRRVVYPVFGSAWGAVRNLTGRQHRQRSAAANTRQAADQRRRVDAWNEGHGR